MALLLASGYGMVIWGYGGFAHLPLHVDIMQTIGIVMVLVFAHLYFAPWARVRRAVDAGDFAAAAPQLDQIRRNVAFNLVLGLADVVIGATGRYWG